MLLLKMEKIRDEKRQYAQKHCTPDRIKIRHLSLRFFRWKEMPVRFKVIQFVCQFHANLTHRKKLIHGDLFAISSGHPDPQHQFSL